MDFITLASLTTPRFLRQDAMLTEEGGNTDNFSNLDTNTASPPLSPSYNIPPSQEIPLDTTETHPLLSPSAEAELYVLATNFLLYVAMVIITTMVAKIYFPESLRRGGDTMPRSVSYNLTEEDAKSEQSSYYGSEGEEDSKPPAGEHRGLEMEGQKHDDVDEMERLVEGEGEGDEKEKRTKKKKGRSRSSSVGSSYLEFDQATASRTAVVKRLLFCSLMLNVTFVTWGVLQERMLTRRYPRYTGEYFTYSYALVFSNRFWTLVMSGLLMLYLKPRRSRSTVIYEYSFPSISNMLSSWCQYEALRYVSFPASTLFKCFKLVPVMMMGKILGNKEYPQYDYFIALIIGVGIAMFMASTDELQFGYDIHGDQISGIWTGIMLLGLYLFFDSFTGQWQSRMFQRHRDLSMIELLFATSAFSTVLSFITLIHTNELGPAFEFVFRHSEIHLHFFVFSMCSTVGQLFIFYTIKNFGAVVFTIIMNTRILLSIALSCVLYDHQVTSTAFFGLVLVMAAVCYRIKRKAEGLQLIKWQGMGDEKAVELVQEWHEHLDM